MLFCAEIRISMKLRHFVADLVDWFLSVIFSLQRALIWQQKAFLSIGFTLGISVFAPELCVRPSEETGSERGVAKEIFEIEKVALRRYPQSAPAAMCPLVDADVRGLAPSLKTASRTRIWLPSYLAHTSVCSWTCIRINTTTFISRVPKFSTWTLGIDRS